LAPFCQSSFAGESAEISAARYEGVHLSTAHENLHGEAALDQPPNAQAVRARTDELSGRESSDRYLALMKGAS
jgi:hypothetical protein